MNQTLFTQTILPTTSLWRRELVRFVRQKGRMFGSIGQSIIFWILIGTGLRSSFRLPSNGMNSMEYLLPGAILLVVLFSSIFSTFSVIDDKSEGFLQGVMASPISRSSLVFGKVLGGATLATIQGAIMLALSLFTHISLGVTDVFLSIAMLFLISIGLTALGFALAWKVESTQSFHAIMGVFIFPMWLLSGALFPLEGAPLWLTLVMKANPLTYHLAALRGTLYWGSSQAPFLPLGLSFTITLLFTVVSLTVAIKGVKS